MYRLLSMLMTLQMFIRCRPSDREWVNHRCWGVLLTEESIQWSNSTIQEKQSHDYVVDCAISFSEPPHIKLKWRRNNVEYRFCLIWYIQINIPSVRFRKSGTTYERDLVHWTIVMTVQVMQDWFCSLVHPNQQCID